MDDDLIHLLEEHQINYEIIDHNEPIRSAQEGAAFFGIEIGQTAPTLILKSGTTMYAFIMSGDYGKIDFDVIKQLLQCEELKLAKPLEVEEATGYSVGSVPLIGHGLPTIIDRRLHRYPYVYGGTGAVTSTLKIGPQDIEKLNHIIAYDR